MLFNLGTEHLTPGGQGWWMEEKGEEENERGENERGDNERGENEGGENKRGVERRPGCGDVREILVVM